MSVVQRTARAVNTVSATELQRRWTAVRAQMRAQGLDALVVQNSSDWVGGYIRWFSNQPATNGYPSSLVFPVDGGMTFIEQGPFGGVREISPEECHETGIARRVTTPSYPSVIYSGTYDAELALEAIGQMGARKVGLVAPAAMYHTFGRHLEHNLGAERLSDATDMVDRIKAIKSTEEIQHVREVAAMQDEVLAQTAAFVRPGLKEFEIAAYAQYVGQNLGSEQGIFLCSSAPEGQAATFRPRSMQGRTLQQGDVFSLLIENNGSGGFYTELSRLFVLGLASEELKEAHSAVIEAQQFALSLLKPGAACSDIHARHNAYLRQQNLPEERRLSIHGMGYDMVERPLIRGDEAMTIESNMVIVCHPGILNDRMFVHNTDVYLIESEGPSACLHKTPKSLIELNS